MKRKQTACEYCLQRSYGLAFACDPRNHSPGGYLEDTVPLRPGKTKRDRKGKERRRPT